MCINTWEATLYFHGKTKGLGMPPQQMLRICYISPEVRTPFVENESVQGTLLQLYEAASMVEGHRGVQRRGRWMWPRQNFPGTAAAAAAAKSLQSCLTLCDPINSSPPGSPAPGILQARTLEWVAISVSNAWKWKVKGKSFSYVLLFTTPWTAAYQAPPSMRFSRQEYWSGVPLPSLKYCYRDS